MDALSTPKACLSALNMRVPPTPALIKIGYGTGVSVYHLSPKEGNGRSPWAIKKPNGTRYADRIKREAEIMKSLHHPNIIGFRGVMKTEDQRDVLAMEQCTQSLGDIIESRNELGKGPFEPRVIYTVILGVAKALDYLHSRKILHGDIKSYNILIKDDFELVKLCDFGASLELGEDMTAPLEAYTGTMCWNAPETFADGPITPKCDIFSLGLTIWEMLALVPPHSSMDPSMNEDSLLMSEESFTSCNSSFDAKLGTRPSLPEIELGPEYDTIIQIFLDCTEQDFNKRPTCKEILEKLKGIDIE